MFLSVYLFLFEDGRVFRTTSFDAEDVLCVSEGILQILNISNPEAPLEMDEDGNFQPVSALSPDALQSHNP